MALKTFVLESKTMQIYNVRSDFDSKWFLMSGICLLHVSMHTWLDKTQLVSHFVLSSRFSWESRCTSTYRMQQSLLVAVTLLALSGRAWSSVIFIIKKYS